MPRDLARPTLTPARRVADLPPGPVALWMAVFSADAELLGAAPITAPPRWVWQEGRFGIDYGQVRVTLDTPGRYQTGYVVAVAGQAWRPVARIELGGPGPELGPGDFITITDNTVILFDLGGGPNDPTLLP